MSVCLVFSVLVLSVNFLEWWIYNKYMVGVIMRYMWWTKVSKATFVLLVWIQPSEKRAKHMWGGQLRSVSQVGCLLKKREKETRSSLWMRQNKSRLSRVISHSATLSSSPCLVTGLFIKTKPAAGNPLPPRLCVDKCWVITLILALWKRMLSSY